VVASVEVTEARNGESRIAFGASDRRELNALYFATDDTMRPDFLHESHRAYCLS
jgi:hypothetical protein